MIRSLASVLLTCGVVVIASACSDPTPPAERVIMDATMGPGANPETGCGITDTEWVAIGAFGNPPDIPVRTVDNGGDNGNGAVTITCSVKGNDASGYAVNASAELQGTEGGTVSITGTFTTTGDQSGISATFERSDYGPFKEADCTVSYAANPNMGVAAGRVWGTLDCPTITRADQNRICAATAQFRFENCDQ